MFGKWELVEEAKPMVCRSFNVVFGYSAPYWVTVDVYRKKRLNGMYKYKSVIRK